MFYYVGLVSDIKVFVYDGNGNSFLLSECFVAYVMYTVPHQCELVCVYLDDSDI